MNQEFVNKVIKVIFKILGNFKIIKKKKVMPTDNQQPTPPVIPTIGGNTQIVFTVKTFLATLGSILGLFVGFYFMVFVPRADKTEEYQKELYDQQHEYISTELGKVNSSITKNTGSIEDLTGRFEDLNDSFEDIANSGGSFGGGTAMGTPAVTEDETTLASNGQD